MRIPFPTRISPFYSSVFALLLCSAQALEGTPLYFCLYSFLFIVIATLAFNAVGGFSRPSGSYIFFYAVLVVIFGLVCKALLGEPADSHLLDPHTTMLVYVAGISAMYAAAWLAHRLLPRKSLLEGMANPKDWGVASVGCVAVGIALSVWDALSVDVQQGSLVTAVRQLNQFLPLGILLGTLYTSRKSGGRRLLSLPVIVGVVFMLAYNGIILASKQGFFAPLFCVLIVAAAVRYRFSVLQVAVLGLTGFFLVLYVVPYIQYAKGQLTDSISLKVDFAVTTLTHPSAFIETATEAQAFTYEETDKYIIHYYDEPHGFADRLQMISIDDALIDVTDQGHVFGIFPVLFGFENIIPHFIWKDKPVYPFGNMYNHEIGYAHYASHGRDDDTTTGISFSPTADAYHEAKWIGVLLIAPLLWFLTFFLLDWICGDTRKAPWGMLAALLCAHWGPEAGLGGPIFLMTIGLLGIYVVAITATYALPIIGTLLTGQRTSSSLSRSPRRPSRQSSALLPSPALSQGPEIDQLS